MQNRKRVLVFVIAYRAESTLSAVLDRIPAEIFAEYEAEILVVDDASADRTFEVGREWRSAHPNLPVTVLRNEYNQGYGGNQKVGYAYAIAEGFDYVAMVHGDGQYAPEELPRLLAPLKNGEADAVFGSRMLERFGALKGGMPLYKYAGNKILSTVQNALLRADLSEFHSGYRLYRVSALRQIPFRLNSNDFHFDTEIIIQFLNANLRIVELPIPTYYGDEICHVNGMKYAKDVMLATMRNVAHRSGVLYRRQFDLASEDNLHYDLKLGYPSSHSLALEAIPAGASVLDIGAGPGGLAQELRKKGCRVAVVDQFPSGSSDEDITVFTQDLDDPPQYHVGPYQYILLLDVLEHLRSPDRFLERLRAQFTHEPKTIILTTPNIAFLVQRLMLLAGQFNYGKHGILDRTHTRLYTFRTIRMLLSDAGFRVKRIEGIPAPFPKALGDNALGHAALRANSKLISLSKTVFSYQIYIEAETTPDVDYVLRNARKISSHPREL